MREVIQLEDNYDNKQLICRYGDDSNNEEFEHVDQFHTSHDGEKGAGYYDVILQRQSDGKFFKFKMSRWSAGEIYTDFRGEEVFPETIRTTIYI